MTLNTLKQLPSINGNKDEMQRRIRRIQAPIESQDSVNKVYVDERGTFVGSGDAVSNGSITLKDSGGTDRKVMIKA